MPISRYDIRNEYSLADPELYRAADKDDPEALLEGVAMAGLVGVLRQLGDLAEFAAEIFHDLHEEVMATAARGHGLMIRVQQLEAEVPSIEKAFLSQTDHSSFFYNSGADWRSNLRMDHNVVTKGDLPRFVMDSYEECRGPPRLFLLDKFDVAGAGACLKRYTDPSFFKVESSAMANADAQREKKFRKAKKKVPRGRYGETPELLPASHAKLHHVFLEEPDDKGVSKPAHRAKLKKRMNGFPFDSKTGKSYMEKLLKTPSPEHKMLHEITASPPLWVGTNDHHESDLDILELRSVSPAREIDGRKISSPPTDRKETLNPIMNQTNDGPTDIEICEVPSYLNLVTDGIPATFDEEHGEKDITVYEEGKAEGSSIGYQSDDIASEIDNYMDAPSTIESEMDTDSEMRVKKNSTSSYVKSRSPVSVENDEHLQSQSSDSQSTGDLTISNEKSISCKKEVSSLLSSASSRTSAENPQSKDLSAEEFPSADVPEIDSVNTSAYQKATDDDFPAEGLPEPVVSNHTFLGKDALHNKGTDFEQHSSNFCSSTLIPILPHCDSGVVRKGRLMGSKSEKTASTSKTNLIIDTPCSHSVSHSKSLSGDDSPRSSGEHLVAGEDAPFMSNIADTIDHISHSPAAISAYLLHEDDNYVEDNQFENVTFTSNMGNLCSQNNIDTEEIISSDSATQCKLSDEAAILPDHFTSDSTHIAHGGDGNTSKVPEVEQQNGNLYNEDSIVVSDAPNPLSCVMEAAIGMKFREIPWTNAKTVTSEDHYASSVIVNQISSETLILSGTEDSFGLQGAGLDAHDRDLIPEEAKRVNEIPELGTPKSFVVVGLQGANDVTPNDLEDPAGISDTAEKDGFHPDSGITALETTENSRASDLELLSEVHVQLDKSDSETDQLETAPIACSVLPVSDKTSRENVNLPAGHDILVEEHIPCFEDSGLVEHGIDKTSLSGSNRKMELVAENRNYLSGSHGQSGLMDEVDERDDAPLEHHREVRNYVLDTDREYFLGNGVNDQGADANSSPIDCAAEEPILQEKIELPPDRIDQELPDSQLLINHQKMIDQDSDEGHNNFALSSALVSCSPSVSGISGLSDYVSDASACPMDPPGFIFPPRNLLSETNQINLDGLPPMPPLPPLQWRTGKLQDTPSTTQEEMVDHKEISPQEIPSPAASTGNSTSSLELMNNHSIQIVPQIPLKEENVEVSSTSSEGNSKHDTVDLRPKIENERHQFMILTQNLELSNDPEIQVSPQISFKEENVEESTTSLNTNSKHETVDLPPTIENERHQFVILTQNLELSNDPEIRVSPQISLKEENVEQSTTSLDTNSKHETVDLPPTIENEKHQLMMPTQKNNEAASPAEEDRVASGKLPRSCNPLIGSAAALDKSKLRKVTERERPQIQTPDERDSLLEQIKAKSFNLKPAVASRPSIRGPKTNLKVAAILEKANAIRQALAGSDEDDDDNWSDS